MKRSNDGNYTTTARIKRDLKEIYDEKTPMIHIVPHDSDITKVHALIEGPADTPYEGGFFYFLVRFPNTYPSQPPTVILQTTGSGKVRFNPNLYANGRVCLSILHTWEGPRWTPALSLKSVLLSIQSLMNEEPYYNEPGFEKAKGKISKESLNYNQEVEYHTLMVAVIGMLEDSRDVQNMPQALKDVMVQQFRNNFGKYLGLLEKVRVPGKGTNKEKEKSKKAMKERLMSLKNKFGIESEKEKKEVEEPVDSYKAVSSKYLGKHDDETDADASDAFIDDLNACESSEDVEENYEEDGESEVDE